MSYSRRYDDEPEPMTSYEKPKNLFISEYADIMVKVNSDVYHLDKLQLVVKSDYFEKLFTVDFQEKNADLIELSLIDSKTFSAIVDIIYGEKLKNVINAENCIPVLMAMDYLQMEIDLKVFATSMQGYCRMNSSPRKPMHACIFKMYNLISENQKFSCLLPSVFLYLSKNLLDFRGDEDFLALSIEPFLKIISIREHYDRFEYVRKFTDFCVDWIWYDVENRLPHLLKCVNAAKRRFGFPHDVKNGKLIDKLQSHGDRMRRETLTNYFHKMLMYGANIDAAAENSESNVPLNNNFPTKFYHDKNEPKKWAKFFDSGDLYDVTLKVEEKTYKLHRIKFLKETGSRYFENLFKSERLATSGTNSNDETNLRTAIRPNKDKVYFLDGIDEKSFDLIIRYIYLNEAIDSQLTPDSIIGVLKAEKILKMRHSNLEWSCYLWATENIDKISWNLATEILDLTRENTYFEDFHKLYFRRHVPLDWPEIGDNVPLFCSVSFEMLEEILLSETLHFDEFSTTQSLSFCIWDQYKLLDICSKWIIHDVKNRYQLIPQIALAINCNGMVDYEDYQMELPEDLANCSQQLIRDKLLEILHSTLLIPTKKSIKPEAVPAFISKTGKKINILNDELEDIDSLSFSRIDESHTQRGYQCVLSAAMVKDNVFIVSEFLTFQVYNVSTKNFVTLSCVPHFGNRIYSMLGRLTLLNCGEEIYCCFQKGYLLKYLPLLNRWTIVSQCGYRDGAQFASDGRQLYSMHIESRRDSLENVSPIARYCISIYDFVQNAWNPLENMFLEIQVYDNFIGLAFVNGSNLLASFNSNLFLCNIIRRNWVILDLPGSCISQSMSALAKCNNGNGAYISNDKLFHLNGPNQDSNYEEWFWVLKKILIFEKCEYIIAIHRPNVGVDHV